VLGDVDARVKPTAVRFAAQSIASILRVTEPSCPGSTRASIALFCKAGGMDCRVKPGNDEVGVHPIDLSY